jgi:4-hydroxy-tetrahydrodipicolinate reductase
MKISVVGKGKTGSEVIRLLGKKLDKVFDRDRPVSAAALKNSDAVIIFVPGANVADILPIIKQAKIPAVWGSTGFIWPENLDEELNEEHIRWVIANNFSLGMQIIRKALQAIGQSLPRLLPSAELSLHEVHHAQKQDQPSGTALSWEQWLGSKCAITSRRKGDVKGVHTLTIKTPHEEITLTHAALNREIFAMGAIWAAEYLIGYPTLPGGLYQFSDLIDM